MFTTGSKLLIGSAVAAAAFATIYGITQGGSLGTIGLVSAAVALTFLAVINVFLRDSNVSALDHAAFASSAAAHDSARPSLWPLLVAVGATAVTLGLVTERAILILGIGALFVGLLEWVVQAWSERASVDRGYNDAARGLMAHPLELPIAAAAGAGVVVYSFSRVMLGLPSKSATVAAFAVAAALVLAVGTLVGLKRGVGKSTLTGAMAIAALALIAGGTVAGFSGAREVHTRPTTADIADDDGCDAEETEADEKASQSVAGKSNLIAKITYDGSELEADLIGSNGQFDALTLPRSNPNNVMFRNESGHEARLVIEMHPRADANGKLLGPERICTALVEDGGSQFLTLVFAQSSRTLDEGYAFTVPGSDAELEVVIP